MNKPFKPEFEPETVMPILADHCVSISAFKKNPAAVIEAAKIGQVAILNRNRPVAYVISPEAWDHILETFDDLKLAEEVRECLASETEFVEVNIDDL